MPCDAGVFLVCICRLYRYVCVFYYKERITMNFHGKRNMWYLVISKNIWNSVRLHAFICIFLWRYLLLYFMTQTAKRWNFQSIFSLLVSSCRVLIVIGEICWSFYLTVKKWYWIYFWEASCSQTCFKKHSNTWIYDGFGTKLAFHGREKFPWKMVKRLKLTILIK